MQGLLWNSYGMLPEHGILRQNILYPTIEKKHETILENNSNFDNGLTTIPIPCNIPPCNRSFDRSYNNIYNNICNYVYNKTSIFQIPNIGYKYNSYIPNTKSRSEITKAHDCIWLGFGIILEPFNKYNKYRKAQFPSGWKYLIDSLDRDKRRHGWFINENQEIIAEIFVDDNESSKDIYIRIKFLKCIAII